MGINRCFNVMDFRRIARRKLPAPVFHYIDGGADDEWSLRRNTEAYNDYELQPAQLSDVSNVDIQTQAHRLAGDDRTDRGIQAVPR